MLITFTSIPDADSWTEERWVNPPRVGDSINLFRCDDYPIRPREGICGTVLRVVWNNPGSVDIAYVPGRNGGFAL